MNTEKKTANWILIFSIAIAIMLLILCVKGCNSEPEVIKVIHPSVSGSTKISKPESKTLVQDLSTQPFGQNLSKAEADKWKSIADSLLNANIQMKKAFADSSNKDSLYNEVIQPKEFSKTWDDENLKATVSGLYFGAIPAIQLDYDIKPRTQEIKVPQTVFRLLGCIEAGMSSSFDKFNAKANLGFQNKKGNIITVGADTDQRFYLGYTVSIFSIKR